METMSGCCCSSNSLSEVLERDRLARSPLPSLNRKLRIRASRSFVLPKIHFLGAVPLNRCLRLGPLRSSSPRSSLSSSPGPFDLNEVGFGAPEARSMTVRIRFVLRKKCLFGQQFFLVGEDPIFGSWDPSAAIPMTWSEGHIWTVEQNIPIESKTPFKFVLKGGSGEIKWQPGPNRVLKLWITKGTIIIEENWDSPELQKAIEELPQSEFTQMIAKQKVKASGLHRSHETVTQDSVENNEDALLVPGLPVAEAQEAMLDDFTGNTEDPVLVPGLLSKSIYSAEVPCLHRSHEIVTQDSVENNEDVLLVPGLPVAEAQEAMLDDFTGNTEDPVLVPGLLSKSIYSAEVPSDQVRRKDGTKVKAVVEGQPFSSESVTETADNKPEPSNGKLGKELKVMTGQGNTENFPLAAGAVDMPLAVAILKNDIEWGLRNVSKLLWGLISIIGNFD